MLSSNSERCSLACIMTDDSLIKKCQTGDAQAFDQLLNQHYEIMYRYAYKWCGDQHNAQDITQTACLKLAKSVRQFDFKASFTSWLYRLVINCAKDYYKSPTQFNRREESVDYQQPMHDDRNAERLYARQIMEHINSLQEELRVTLILVFGSGLNHQQAAEKLSIKESTVSWRVHEARKQLKDVFRSSTLNQDLDHARGSA